MTPILVISLIFTALTAGAPSLIYRPAGSVGTIKRKAIASIESMCGLKVGSGVLTMATMPKLIYLNYGSSILSCSKSYN